MSDGGGYYDAGAAVGWSVTTVRNELRAVGGIRPRRGRSLKGRSLTFREREEISIMRAQGVAVQEMARRLGRAPSTVSRELRRNATSRISTGRRPPMPAPMTVRRVRR